MKIFNSTHEGDWTASDPMLASRELTEQLRNEDIDPQEKAAIAEQLRLAMAVEVSAEESAALSELYLSIKPELKDSDTYQLIAMDASKSGNYYTGILNCRVNEQHTQVRF